MNVENFAEWLRRQGHHVVRSKSSYWYDAGPRVFQAFPYHWLIQPAPGELRAMTLGRAIAALRYSTPLTAAEGAVSYHVVLHRPYALESLRAQARNGVRRGLNYSHVERISFERLAGEGWVLQADTLDRQGRAASMTRAEWQRICRAADGLPGFEAWGAIHEGELAAALLAARIDDTWCIPYALSHRQHLREHVNNALFYAVSSDLLARDGIAGIFFALQSLDAPESVDEFKFRMGLMPVPVRQRVVFHPCIRPFATPAAHTFVAGQLERKPASRLFAKAEGMLRFYLLGRRPLDAQAWPECLAGCPEKTSGEAASTGKPAAPDARPLTARPA